MSPADRHRPDPGMLTPEQVAARRPVMMFILIAAVLPLTITGIATIVQLFLLRDLPGRIAVHWNAAGQPDNWAPAWTAPVLTAVLGVLMVSLMAVPAIGSLNAGDRGPTYRFLGAMSLGVVTFLAILCTGTAWQQTGGGEANVFVVLITGLIVGAVAGLVGWYAQPEQTAPENGVSVAPLALAEGEHAVWLQTVVAGKVVGLILGTSVIGVGLAALFSWAEGAGWSTIIALGVVTLVTLILSATTVAFRVRVAPDGLTVTSLLGLPRFHVAASDITAVRVDDEVAPIGRFGGYGIRMIGKTTAVIVRRGPAIVVDKTSGRTFAVVVDDAATGAALLSTYAGQAG